MHATLPAKNAHEPVHARLRNGTETLCHGNYCELILSLVRASYRLSFATHAGPAAAVSTKSWQLPDAGRSRKQSESTLAHDAVAAAVSHKHHSIIRVGAGLIQFVYGSQCEHPSKNSIFAIFRASSFTGCTHALTSV